MSVPIGWNTGNDKRDTTALALRQALEGFFMVTGDQLSPVWGTDSLVIIAAEGKHSFDYDDLEAWLNKAAVSPFCRDRGYVSSMILQHLLIWWEAICDDEYRSDVGMADTLINPDYEGSEMTPDQQAFFENAYQDKVEQGEP